MRLGLPRNKSGLKANRREEKTMLSPEERERGNRKRKLKNLKRKALRGVVKEPKMDSREAVLKHFQGLWSREAIA